MQNRVRLDIALLGDDPYILTGLALARIESGHAALAVATLDGLFASIIDDAQHWSRHARSHNAAWLERTKAALRGY